MNRFLVRLAALLTGIVAGCSSPTGDEPSKLVPVSSLEHDYRDLLEAYGEGGERWARARDRARTDPDLERFLVNNLAREMVLAFESGGQTLMATDDNPYQRARTELAGFGASTADLAAGMLAEGDDVLAFHGADLLGEVGGAAVPALTALLEDDREGVRRRAIEVAGELELRSVPLDDVLVERMRTDRAWIVRAQACRALARRIQGGSTHPARREAHLVALEESTRDGDLSVATEAAVGLGPLRDLRAAPALIDVLERAEGAGHPTCARRAQEALKALFDDDGARGAEGWRAHWNQVRSER